VKALGKGVLGLGVALGLGMGSLASAVEPLIVVEPSAARRRASRPVPARVPLAEPTAQAPEAHTDVLSSLSTPQATPLPSSPVPLAASVPAALQVAQPRAVETVLGSIQPREEGRRFPSIDADVHFRTVLRMDELDWNIAGAGVNVLSELTWDGMRATGGELSGRIGLPFGFVALGQAGYGHIHSGDNQDSDYLGPDRTLEFSRSNNGADDGLLLDSSLALGYEITRGPLDLRWMPMVGFAYHSQELNIDEGMQTIPATGPFLGLDSHYDASWFGPWAGLQLSLQPHERLRLKTGLELHAARYKAVANWNLRSDFAHPKSFEHSAQGLGTVLSGELAWQMTRRWTLDLTARWLYFETDPGRDTLYLANGGTLSTRLNQVRWESLQLAAGVTLRF
jgi:hypothetical protein